jgi:hypothetical protein
MMHPALIVELLIRGVAIGAFLAIALPAARRPRTPARITAILFALEIGAGEKARGE